MADISFNIAFNKLNCRKCSSYSALSNFEYGQSLESNANEEKNNDVSKDSPIIIALLTIGHILFLDRFFVNGTKSSKYIFTLADTVIKETSPVPAHLLSATQRYIPSRESLVVDKQNVS